MIITCPNCQTKYQVADQAIGAAGRKVMCANCHQSWIATASLPEEPPPKPPKPKIVAGTDRIDETPKQDESADPDRLFSDDSEAALDQAFADEEERMDSQDESLGANTHDLNVRPETSGDAQDEDQDASETGDLSDGEENALDHKLISRRKRDLAMRQKKQASRSPLARFRRAIRMMAIILFLTLAGLSYQYRTEIVRLFPDLGGLYEMIGLPVNIYGLTFSNVETLRTLKDGADVTIISADIRSVVGHTVRVPSVLVSILNAENQPIYEWTAQAPVDHISPGDIVGFQTQLTSAPADAAHVRLVFGSTAAEQTGP